jgi:hypothetical protein
LGLAKEARPKRDFKFDEITGQTSTIGEPIPPILQATYDKPWLEWSRDITRYVIDTNRSLRIWWILRDRNTYLGRIAQYPKHLGANPSYLPSWVVDISDTSPDVLFFGDFRKWEPNDRIKFSARSYYRNTSGFLPDPYLGDTGGNSIALPSDISQRNLVTEPHPNPDILSVKGYKIDTIQYVGPKMRAQSADALASTWLDYLSAFEHDDVHNTIQSKALQFIWAHLMDGPSTFGFSNSFIGFQTLSSISQINSDGRNFGRA